MIVSLGRRFFLLSELIPVRNFFGDTKISPKNESLSNDFEQFLIQISFFRSKFQFFENIVFLI
mgnify:CR=1 FL=1